MNCTGCPSKNCRHLKPCPSNAGADPTITELYHKEEAQKIVQSAALLVDGGRAGTLSRLEEIAEFAKLMEYPSVGFAYCYGMELLAVGVVRWLRKQGLKISSVSCTAGGASQKQVNEESSLSGVSCNPLSQAEALNKEEVPFAISFGLCMGHDILFNRAFKGDVTTLLVKDRTSSHNVLEAIERII